MPAAPGQDPDDALLRRAYELMYFSRQLDSGLVTWQRQGLVPAYPPMRGQEAAQVGSALALDRGRDLVFPTYRETGVAVAWGVDLPGYLANHLALWHGGTGGTLPHPGSPRSRPSWEAASPTPSAGRSDAGSTTPEPSRSPISATARARRVTCTKP